MVLEPQRASTHPHRN